MTPDKELQAAFHVVHNPQNFTGDSILAAARVISGAMNEVRADRDGWKRSNMAFADAIESASWGLDCAFDDVRDFHVAFGCDAPDLPQMQTPKQVERRAKWMEEEIRELRDAQTLVDQADAYLDLIYFAIGGLVELCVRPLTLWRIIHGANMAKLWADGKPRRRADGKIVKPAGWTPPELELTIAVHDQITDARATRREKSAARATL